MDQGPEQDPLSWMNPSPGPTAPDCTPKKRPRKDEEVDSGQKAIMGRPRLHPGQWAIGPDGCDRLGRVEVTPARAIRGTAGTFGGRRPPKQNEAKLQAFLLARAEHLEKQQERKAAALLAKQRGVFAAACLHLPKKVETKGPKREHVWREFVANNYHTVDAGPEATPNDKLRLLSKLWKETKS